MPEAIPIKIEYFLNVFEIVSPWRRFVEKSVLLATPALAPGASVTKEYFYDGFYYFDAEFVQRFTP